MNPGGHNSNPNLQGSGNNPQNSVTSPHGHPHLSLHHSHLQGRSSTSPNITSMPSRVSSLPSGALPPPNVKGNVKRPGLQSQLVRGEEARRSAFGSGVPPHLLASGRAASSIISGPSESIRAGEGSNPTQSNAAGSTMIPIHQRRMPPAAGNNPVSRNWGVEKERDIVGLPSSIGASGQPQGHRPIHHGNPINALQLQQQTRQHLPQQTLHQQPASTTNQPSQQTASQIRELKVEDALLYLDQVKMEFGDRPRIYNEFLEIMKNFKAQEIDTPGVIARVSSLFRGYNNLILGFNTFLPDGFKIELKDLVGNDGTNVPTPTMVQTNVPTAKPTAPPQQVQPPAQPNPVKSSNQITYWEKVPNFPQTQGTPPNPPPQPPVKQTPVIPPVRQPHIQNNVSPPQQPYPTSPNGRRAPNYQPMPKVGMKLNGMAKPAQQLPQHIHPQPVPSQEERQPQHQAVEFDHAISYVTTIKCRFKNEPRIYQAFLEILHNYQKEQRGIKEVLEQVSSLFADHPDLLKEFTFFLPDAVQEQAKERLHQAARESEARQAEQLLMQQNAQLQQPPPEHPPFVQQKQPDHALPPKAAPAKSTPVVVQQIPPKKTPVPSEIPSNQECPPAAQVAPPSLPPKTLSPPITSNSSQKEEPLIETPEPMEEEKQNEEDNSSAPIQKPPSPQQPPPPPVTSLPETFIYNAAVERQFFDACKDALTSSSRDGGAAWAELLKCLDLYAQEVLSRTEMLGFVEDLLGKRNVDLFEEFKRILAASGSTTPTFDDAWHSVPLSEIDFSRCRRCSPSYRALPRDYPNPPCSERSVQDSKVLNDVWVSLPVGSEESYTFRHMRKNHHEEILFRCEDERFEIDMVVDSNMSTLRRLQPIAEEIAFLSEGKEECGLGGKKFQYKLDKRLLTTIHRNAIARIYGDAGQEMLQLLFENPSVVIPILMQRLIQKDKEWRSARTILQQRWKDLTEINYLRSLDHRSLTWRTTDKRGTSTRTLVAEIKDRALNDGNEGEAAMAARKEKAKEEHGSFYEVTMGSTDRKLDLTNLPKPTKSLFTPHLSLLYENNSWAMRDAYRLLTYAMERGANSPGDKERGHRLWRDFLGGWFGLELSWMQNPALEFDKALDAVNDGPKESRKRSASELDNSIFLDSKPHYLPPGTIVSTPYGDGIVQKFQQNKYEISFTSFQAKGYLQPDIILSTIIPEATSYTNTNQLRSSDDEVLERGNDMLAIGTQSLYVFFRLHQILIRRLNIARTISHEVSCKSSPLTHWVEKIQPVDGTSNPMNYNQGELRYQSFLSLLYSLVDGSSSSGSSSNHAHSSSHHSSHNLPNSGTTYNFHSSSQSDGYSGRYEDRLRSLLGHGAYELATMDKLISHLLKNLQNMGNDETLLSLLQLHRRHRDKKAWKPNAMRQEAHHLSDGEHIFAFQYCQVPHKDSSVLHVEYLGFNDKEEGMVEEQIDSSSWNQNDSSVKDSSDVVMTEAVDHDAHPSKRSRRL